MDSEQQYDVLESDSDSEYDSDDSQEDPTFDLLEETRSSLSKLSIKKHKSKDMSARYSKIPWFSKKSVLVFVRKTNDNEMLIFFSCCSEM